MPGRPASHQDSSVAGVEALERAPGTASRASRARRLDPVRAELCGAIVILYMLACALPVFIFPPTTNPHILGPSLRGLQVLASGWLGLLAGIIGWYANVLFVPAFIGFCLGKYRSARWFALAALAVGCRAS